MYSSDMTDAAVDRQVVDGPNGPIGVTTTGTGPAVVLIAGLGATARLWGELPVVLGREFTTVTMDNRGVGRSRGGTPFSLARAAEDVMAVADALEFQRIRVVGASLGGAIALHVAVAFPDRVAAAVVASAAARLSRHGRRSLELLRDLVTHAPPESVGRCLMTLAFAPSFHERSGGFIRKAEALFGLDPADAPGALAQAEAALAGWDLRPELSGCAVPTLVLAGARDPLVSVEDTAEIATTIPEAQFVRLENAGHSVLAEGGLEVLQRVMTFLRNH